MTFSDEDPLAWVAMMRELPAEVRQRKAEVQAAALAEVGIHGHPSPLGGVLHVARTDASYEEAFHRAHVLSCQAVGIPALAFEAWRIARAFR